MQQSTRLLMGAVAVILALLLAPGCGEKATTPEYADTGMPGLGAHPEASGAAREAYDRPSSPGKDIRDIHLIPGTLLATTGEGLVAIPPDGSWFILSTLAVGRFDVEVMGTRIFIGAGNVYEIDHSGSLINMVTRPAEIPFVRYFSVLPDGGFATFDNVEDEVYFMDAAGNYITKVAMPDSSSANLQNLKGVVRDNTLLVSETGRRKIMAIDLATYEVSVFKDLWAPPDTEWLSDIDFEGGDYYLGRPGRVQRFCDGGPVTTLCDFAAEYNVVGVVAEDPYVYVATGAMVPLADGLDYPLDIELLPVVLEEPPALRVEG
jgi:hypothetical protein